MSGIPGGYQLSDLDNNGHSSQLLQWPDKITVIPDGTPITPSYPVDHITDGSTKNVDLVDESGHVVGTGMLTKNGSQVTISNIPAEYQLSDKNQLLQWPDKITVQKVSSAETRTSNEKAAVLHNKQRTKLIAYVDRQGKHVGSGSMSMTNLGDKIKLHDVPDGYMVANSNQVLKWPDSLTVEKE